MFVPVIVTTVPVWPDAGDNDTITLPSSYVQLSVFSTCDRVLEISSTSPLPASALAGARTTIFSSPPSARVAPLTSSRTSTPPRRMTRCLFPPPRSPEPEIVTYVPVWP